MHPGPSTSQARLWLVSLAASVGINALVIAFIAIWTAQARSTVQNVLADKLIKDDEPTVMLAPMMDALAPKPAPEAAPPVPPPSPRATAPLQRATAATSAEQEAAAPEKSDHQGERNTRATSNAKPVEGAPSIPSLKGTEADDGRKPMTFDSQYRDGDESHAGHGDTESAPAAQTPAPAKPEPAPAAPVPPPAGKAPQAAKPGTSAVDRENLPKPDDAPAPVAETPKETKPADESQTPKLQQESGLSTESQPTKIEGSVAVTGAGSQDVGDTPRGRYTASVTRAIERYWQASLARNRDYMAVGSVRVVIVLEATGKVRTVRFADEEGIGDVQRGVILGSIRDHPLPAMPKDLVKTLKNQSFELNISFIFGS